MVHKGYRYSCPLSSLPTRVRSDSRPSTPATDRAAQMPQGVVAGSSRGSAVVAAAAAARNNNRCNWTRQYKAAGGAA